MSVRNIKEFLIRELKGNWHERYEAGYNPNHRRNEPKPIQDPSEPLHIPNTLEGIQGFYVRGISPQMTAAIGTLLTKEHIPYGLTEDGQLEMDLPAIRELMHKATHLKIKPRHHGRFDSLADIAATEAGLPIERGGRG